MLDLERPPTTRAELIDEVLLLREKVATQERIIATLRRQLFNEVKR